MPSKENNVVFSMISTFILRKTCLSNSIKILVKESNSNKCTHFTWDIKFYDNVYVFFINFARQINPTDLIQMKKKVVLRKNDRMPAGLLTRNISMQTMLKKMLSQRQSHHINVPVASSDAVVMFDLFSQTSKLSVLMMMLSNLIEMIRYSYD